jgi:primosomal protein N' (replication factor Y)
MASVSGDGAGELVAALPFAAAPDGDAWLVRANTWDELGSALAEAPRPKGSRVRIEVDPPRR